MLLKLVVNKAAKRTEEVNFNLASSCLTASAPVKAVSIKGNLVTRDRNQGAFANGQVQTDEDYLRIAKLFDSLNQAGPTIFKSFESGGQEFGSHVMLIRSLDELLKSYTNSMPNGAGIRSLTRGVYGNGLVPLHPNDLKKLLEFVHVDLIQR